MQQNAGNVSFRTRAGRRVLQLGLIGFGIGNELRQRACRKVSSGYQNLGGADNDRDRLEVFHSVIEWLLIEGLIVTMRAAVAEQELVTVGCRFSHTGGASHSSGAADVFDDDLLTENLAKARRHDASIGVDGPSGRDRNH